MKAPPSLRQGGSVGRGQLLQYLAEYRQELLESLSVVREGDDFRVIQGRAQMLQILISELGQP